MKKSKSQEAKFFCESCGSEVPGRAKVCPVCGKFFASVRCPKCGRTGVSEDFKNGCPTCGYAVNIEEQFEDDYDYDYSSSGKNNKKRKNKKSSNISSFNNRNRNNRNGGNDSSLPPWIYILTVLVLVILIICFYSCL